MSEARPGSGVPQGAIADPRQPREGDAEGSSGQPQPPREAAEKAGASLAAEPKRRRPSEDEEEGAALLGEAAASEAALGDGSSPAADLSPSFSPLSWWRRLRRRLLLLPFSWPSSAPAPPPPGTQRCPCAPARSIARCCHGGAKMAALAYTLGKREINHYFSVKSAKALALGAVLLLAACHAVSRRYQGDDSCEYLLSSGRFLGEKLWQPHSCMMHKYKPGDVKDCLANKHIAFIGDSRIRQLFYSFVKLINPQIKEEGNKHGNIPFEDKSSSLKVDFLWYPEVNGSMKQRFNSWNEGSSPKPNIIIAGAATWSIKIHNGSSEALTQYKINITLIAPLLEKLAKSSDVYWVLQDPVYEDMLSESRKMITNEKIDAYNEAAVSILNSSARNLKARVKVFSASRLIAEETIMQSLDGLHLPESSREVSATILMNVYCNKVMKPVDGSCCQPRPPITLIQKLAFCFFGASAIGYLILVLVRRNNHRKNKPCTDMESGEEKKPPTNSSAVSTLETLLLCLSKLGLIMAYFYLCDRANLFMKENKFYTHSSFFIPIIYILVLGVFYTENTKETKVLNREQTDEWKGWMQLVILIYHISGASTAMGIFHTSGLKEILALIECVSCLSALAKMLDFRLRCATGVNFLMFITRLQEP
uniref:N-acetylneuraminate 9-O-acetyltransferase n=1 Tax=Sphaerodactylus townsendi TaxID=933632 RepID=A0ACB8FVK8_9SAUR